MGREGDGELKVKAKGRSMGNGKGRKSDDSRKDPNRNGKGVATSVTYRDISDGPELE